MKKIITFLFILISSFSFAKPKIGITLLPYYSYVKNIVKDKMDVVPVIPENADVHSYKPNANDIKKLTDLDFIVINGIGHDEFVKPMIESAKKNNKKLIVINANARTTILNTAGQKKAGIKNPHTFIAITQVIEQVNYIAKELGNYDSANKDFYIKNAIEYKKRLLKIKRDAKNRLKGIDISDINIATTHAGYDYILNEFGLTVSAVVEPAHAQNPNSNDLRDTIDKIKKKHIQILFDEVGGNHKNAQIIQKETGIKVERLSHVTSGKYEANAFEIFIKQNVDTIVNAIISLKKEKK